MMLPCCTRKKKGRLICLIYRGGLWLEVLGVTIELWEVSEENA